MKQSKTQTFLQGALTLVIANLIVKIIGALFKIPLRHLIGPDGMGIYNTSYVIYTWLFIIATAGLPIAVSKMVSESIAKQNKAEAKRIFKVAYGLLSIIGITGTMVLFFGAGFFADILGNSRAYYSIMAMSPSLFFVALMSAYRGYFQGMQNMVPTAISEIVEALGKLIIGFLLAYLWINKGVEYAASGAILGVSSGTFLGAVILSIIYKGKQRKGKALLPDGDTTGLNSRKESRKTRQIITELIKIAIPITIGASVFTLTNVIDVAMIMNRLRGIGFTEQQASTWYGHYSTDAVTLFNLPPTIIVALSISIVPAIASVYAVKNYTRAKKTTESALRITLLFSLPCAVGLSILAKPILLLIFNDAGAETLLNILGIAVVPVSLVLVSNAILQATGYVMLPVKNMLIGGIIKVISNYILVGIPKVNINGAPIGTNLCYFIIIILNMIAVKRITKAEYRIKEFLIKPLFAVFAMAVSVLFTYKNINNLTDANSLATVAAIAVGGIIYILVLLAIGGINKDDLENIPKGEKVLRILNKLGLMR